MGLGLVREAGVGIGTESPNTEIANKAPESQALAAT